MYRQHFGLTHAPLAKDCTDLWDDGTLALLAERFQWLLDSPGIGLLTGEPGVGKTARPPRCASSSPRSTPIASKSTIWPRPTSVASTCTAVSPTRWVSNPATAAPSCGAI